QQYVLDMHRALRGGATLTGRPEVTIADADARRAMLESDPSVLDAIEAEFMKSDWEMVAAAMGDPRWNFDVTNVVDVEQDIPNPATECPDPVFPNLDAMASPVPDE